MKASELRIGNFIMSGNNGIFDADGTIGSGNYELGCHLEYVIEK